MLRLPLLLLRLLVLVLLLPVQIALAGVTTGVIKGTTVDEGGLPIPGVLVTIKSPNLMGVRQGDTDIEGRFFFAELPPGVYELTAEKPGFAKISKPNLEVYVGRNTAVTIEMPLRSSGEEIVVEGSRPSIDTEQTSQTTVLTKEFLQRIPSGRSYQQVVQAAPGVSGGSNPNVGGASYNENTYVLDGVNITDPVTGTFSLNFDFEAIEEIQVLTSAFDPEYGVNLGGVIALTSESGGNTLEFKVTGYYENGNWSPKLDARYAADGYELAPTDYDSQYQILSLSAKLAGPIIRDKMWFISTYRMERSLISYSGVKLPRDYEGHYVFGKLTWQPSASHKFTLLAQTNPTSIDNIVQSRYSYPEAEGRQAQGGFITSLQWQWFPLPTASFDSKNSIQKLFIELSQVPCTHDQDLGYNPCSEDELENSIDYLTPSRVGQNNAYSSGNFYYFMFDDRWSLSTSNKFSLLQVDFLGTHDLKFGLEADARLRNYTVMYGGNMLYYDLNALAYNPDTYSNYYWVEYSGPRVFDQDAYHVGAFAQDAWKPVDNLTMRYGMRFDRSTIYNDVGEQVLATNAWGPRFGVAWDPWGNNKTKFSAAIGRFNDMGRLAVAGFLNRTDIGSKLFLGEYFGAYTNATADNYSYTPANNPYIVADELVAPHSDDLVIGAEREIIQDLVALANVEFKRTENLYEDDETNLYWDEDGYNVIGTYNGDYESIYRLRTPSVARRDYMRLTTGFRRNWADRWLLQAYYSYTKSRGTTLDAIGSYLDTPPQDQYYEDQILGTDLTHQATLSGAWDLPGTDPWTTTLGALIDYQSGYPTSRTYSSPGLGSYYQSTIGTYARTEGYVEMNIRAEQAIPVRKGKLSGVVELSNVFNSHQGTAYVSGDNRWIIYDRQNPLSVTAGAEYEF